MKLYKIIIFQIQVQKFYINYPKYVISTKIKFFTPIFPRTEKLLDCGLNVNYSFQVK